MKSLVECYTDTGELFHTL